MRLVLISILLSFLFTNCPTEGNTDLVNMNASVNPEQAGTVNPPEGTYTSGKQITVVTDASDERWQFTGWSGDTTASVDSLTFDITQDMELVANYEIPSDEQSILVATANPAEGGTVVPDSGSFNFGSTVDVEAIPAQGWEFAEWSGDTTATSNPLSLTMDSDYNLTAVFEQTPPDEYTLTTNVQPSDGGTVDPSGGSFEPGANITVSATPVEGWQFSSWSGDTTVTANPIEITMDKNYSLTANFEELPDKQLTTSAQPSEGGNIQPADGTFNHGASVQVEAMAARGWNFVDWSGDTSATANPLDLIMNKDYNLVANFEKEMYTLATDVSPSSGGTVSPSSQQYEFGTSVNVEATASSGWEFTSWSGDTTVSANPITVTVDKDYSLTANFRELSQAFTNRITVTDGASSKDVVFGMKSNATAGFDNGIDVELPPRPPSGNFYRRFNIPDYGLKEDYRAIREQETVWELEVAPEAGRTITLNWDFSGTNHVGTLTLTDDPDNPSFEIDMKSQTSYNLSNESATTLYIISQN